MKIAIISTYPPQKCGIATFAQDLYKSLNIAAEDTIHIVAITNIEEYTFPKEVAYTIQKQDLKNYVKAADFINTYDLCLIQHEYGIFGGESGEYILTLCKLLHLPIIINFHTILTKPSLKEREVLQELGQISNMVTVMTNWAVNMLHSIYQIPFSKIKMIPHGVPVFDYQSEQAKKKLNLQNKKVLLSFGFLGRGKGLETAIEAVTEILDPTFIYIILGITHPNVIKEEGESYRNLLINKCKQLGISDKVEFVNEFATEDLLKDYLTACDMYVTPYPNESQISSGTLTFALGAGAAVISTPYLYAKDLLADERGLFFDFCDAHQLANTINVLLKDSQLLQSYRNKAREHGEQIQWPNIGKRHIELIHTIHTSNTKFYKHA